MKAIKTNVLQATSLNKLEFKKDVFITWKDDTIISVDTKTPKCRYENYTKQVCIPGLIDTHIHLSQYNARGKHSSNLLDWLNNYIFPEEKKAHSPKYAYKTAKNFFTALLKAGTTCSLVYTAPFFNACDTAFEVAKDMGIRTFMGVTLMDTNCPDFLKQNTDEAIIESQNLYNKWNGIDNLNFAFTPRFAPVCTSRLMLETANFAKKNKAIIQTHLSENLSEISWVNKLFPSCKNYTDIYNKHNILGKNTVMAHGIYLDNDEITALKNSNTKIAHCPDSNFFLKSGVFNWEKIQNSGIDFSIATDVAAGTNFSLLYCTKIANYMQTKYIINPIEAFYKITNGAAKVLNQENSLGLIKANYKADFVLLNIENFKSLSDFDLCSLLCYTNQDVKVKNVWVAGNNMKKYLS